MHAELPEYVVIPESSGAASLHFVPSDEEVSNAVVDVMIDEFIEATQSLARQLES